MSGLSAAIPAPVQTALALLRGAGFEALPVGGCVRDLLLGRTPHDWDITTAATPDRMLAVFDGLRVETTGLRHGTVTLILEHMPIEITAFRAEGAYSDGRRPDGVTFGASLRDDLSRRDFTVNAMCLAPDGAVVDLFGGQQDLRAGVIRAIGDPSARFGEDALRMLRALRFAAVLGFAIEPQTAGAIVAHTDWLARLSAERVAKELLDLLCAPHCLPVLLDAPCRAALCAVVPALAPCIGLRQRPDYHCWDVYEHTMRAVAAAPPDPVLRMTMLLHDLGKPATADGQGHFYGHVQAGAPIAQAVLQSLRLGNRFCEQVRTLVALHDLPFDAADPKRLRRLLARHGEQTMFALCAVRRADTAAQNPAIAAARLAAIDQTEAALRDILAAQPALTLRALQIDGGDLLALGLAPGPQVGALLRTLLDEVVAQTLPNEHTALLTRAKALL